VPRRYTGRKIRRLPHEKIEKTGLLFAWFWVARGKHVATAMDYVRAYLNGTRDHIYAERALKAIENPRPTPPAKDFDLIREFVLDGQRLTELWRKYSHLVGYDAFKRDFIWWCRKNGHDPQDFFIAGTRRRGYWVPLSFVRWWENTVLPQYTRPSRWVTAEEVGA